MLQKLKNLVRSGIFNSKTHELALVDGADFRYPFEGNELKAETVYIGRKPCRGRDV